MRKNLRVMLAILLTVGLLTICGCGKQEQTKTSYTVTFDTDGGSEISSITVEEGSLATKPTDPTKEGYIFGGWEYEGEEYNFNATVSKNITLKAKWEKTATRYTVKFDSDGGSTVYPITVSENEVATRPSDPRKDGFVFKYWTLNGAEYNFSTPVTENIELKAVWEVDVSQNPENQTFTVTFDSDGGSNVEAQTVKNGKKATAPKNPTKAGYVFLDWTLNDKIYKFSTKVTADITLKATWAVEGTYTITFDTNGSTDVIEKQKVKAGKLVTKPTDPTREGYELKEWRLDGQPYDFSTKVSGDMVLKAEWQLPHFKVTFDTDGGSTVKAQSIEIEKTAKKPTNPTKTGHTFKTWLLGEEEYDFATPVTEDITLKASWDVNKYKVTFDSDGGSEVPEQEVEYNGTVTKPENPTKEGYEFTGWKLSKTDYKFTEKVTKAITLKATWKKETEKTYTFNYESIESGAIVSASPDVTLYVYENGTKINFVSASANGYQLCKGTNPTVGAIDLQGVTTIKVVLQSGKEVTATYKK